MAGGPGVRAAFGNAVDVGASAAIDSDGYDSGAGFDAERRRASREASRSLLEVERARNSNPELAAEVLDNADADEVLLQQILVDRRGLRGVWNRFKNSRITRGAITCLKWGAVLVGGAAVVGAVAGGGLALASAGVMAAGALEGGAIGAAVGAISGRRRGKAAQEDAATWMSDLRILRSTHPELERRNEGDLMMALGVMRNAIVNRQVRGTDATRMEMVLKYRQIKEILARRRNEARAAGTENEDMNPVLGAIDDALRESGDELKAISEAAGEKYQGAYDTLIEDKHQIVRAHMRASALRRGGFGLLFGALAPMFHAAYAGPDAAVSTVGHGAASGVHAAGGAHAAASGAHVAGESVAMAKMHALQGTDQIARETASHAAQMNDFAAGVHGGMPFPPGTDPSIMQQLTRLEDVLSGSGAHGSLSGFAHAGDMANFNGMLHGGMSNIHGISEFLWHHNIDPTYSVNGHPFAEVLASNQSAFLASPEIIQKFILDHPSVADDFFALLQHGTPAAASALLAKLSSAVAFAAPYAKAALPSAAVGGVAAAFTPPVTRVGTKLYQQKANDMTVARQEAIKEVTDAEEVIQTRRQERLINQLNGGRIRLENPFFGTFITIPVATPPVPPRPDQNFDIESIDPDGNIKFVFQNTAWDQEMTRAGGNPYPPLNIRAITNATRTELNGIIARLLLSADAAAADRVRQAEVEARRREQEAAGAESLNLLKLRLKNATVIFQNAFLVNPLRNYPATTPTFRQQYQISDVPANGATGRISLRPSFPTEVRPTINLEDIITLDPATNQYDINRGVMDIVLEATPAPAAPGTPAAPGAPATPAAPIGPDQAALQAEFITNTGGREQEGRIVEVGGRRVFRRTTSIPSLNNSFDFPLDSTVTLPAGASALPRLRIRFNEVKVTGGNATFNGDVFFRADNGGTDVDYRIEQRFNPGTTGGASNPKIPYLNLLNTIAPAPAPVAPGAGSDRAHMHMIYFRDLNPTNYLRFDHVEPGTAAGGGAAATPPRYVFNEIGLDGAIGGDFEIDRPTLEANSFFRLQQEVI